METPMDARTPTPTSLGPIFSDPTVVCPDLVLDATAPTYPQLTSQNRFDEFSCHSDFNVLGAPMKPESRSTFLAQAEEAGNGHRNLKSKI